MRFHCESMWEAAFGLACVFVSFACFFVLELLEERSSADGSDAVEVRSEVDVADSGTVPETVPEAQSSATVTTTTTVTAASSSESPSQIVTSTPDVKTVYAKEVSGADSFERYHNAFTPGEFSY